MKKHNQSCLTEIVLLGFSDFRIWQELLFSLILIFYLIALMGNGLVLLLTIVSPTLHTPMYFFLWNLSFLEIGYTSSISPKMLVNLLSEKQTISFWGCGCQMYFFLLFGVTECCLLCVMAYDRYVAICKPLQYPYIMNLRECAMLAAVSWATGVFVGVGYSVLIFTLPFCGSNQISHFFCDLMPVLRLASTYTYKNEVTISTLTVVADLILLLLILYSYILIISAILMMPLAKDRRKAFSTCSSHLTVVFIFYGTIIFTYIHPNSAYSAENNRVFALLYTVVTPSLNPIIYSLRNKEIKAAFMKSLRKKQTFYDVLEETIVKMIQLVWDI
ncbi:olfactory receptor 10P1-like [Protobothrops mucrosquamatus]|uniref:olfactory receptor 10P1-like n=1 Tax=Protobothrops mucrosquamatus TaxID=103944 RepID=UPI000775DAE8|nr:olfactory receptor 10P1-like [Protobothrops mucrosquamatus]